jgi:amino acid transporter
MPNRINDILTAIHPRFLTPHWAVVVNCVVTSLFATFLGFGALVKIDQFCYGLRVVMIFLTVIRLRFTCPFLPRPFRIPLSNDQLIMALAVPLLFSIGLTVLCMIADTTTFWMCAGTTVATVVLSLFYCRYVKPEGFEGKIVTKIIDVSD